MTILEQSLRPFITNSFGDRYLYSVNRNTFNNVGSDTLYNICYGDTLFRKYHLHIIIGTDSGLFINYVLKHDVPPGSRFLFIELDEVYQVLEEEGVLNDLPDHVMVSTKERWTEDALLFKIDDYIYIESALLHESLAAADAYLIEYRELLWTINLDFASLVYNIRVAVGNAVFIQRQLENLTENRLNFSKHLEDRFKGKTAMILAGGPSLKAAIPWAKRNRDKVVIIAVSRICTQLLQENLVPHIIVSVDPHKVSFDVSKDMFSFADSSLFLHLYHVTPLLLGQWRGRNVFGGPLMPWQSGMNEDTLTYFGPTVSNTALSFATYMGFSQIILAGVDMCHSREGYTHSDGSNESKVGPKLGHVSNKVETYGGWDAETIQAFVGGLSAMELQIQISRQRGCKVYNCALGAAKVPGIEYRSLEEFQIPEADEPVEKLLARLLPPETAESRITHYRCVKKEIETIRTALQEILKLTKDALKCCDGLFGRNGVKADFKHKLRMDKIEEKLDGKYRKLTGLVKLFGLKSFLNIVRAPEQEADWSNEQIEEVTLHYYRTYEKSTVYFIETIDEVLMRIEARIEEETEPPDFKMLSELWKRDNQPGRTLVWHQNHPGCAERLGEVNRASLKELEEEFAAILLEEETTQLANIQKSHDIASVRSKAILLFKRKEAVELEALAQGLATYHDQEKALPYLHLVQGFLAELRDEHDKATEFYQALLVDPPHPATEDALKQIAALALDRQDVENAVLALDCLSQISPVHLPLYGDLLKIINRYEDAFNAYNRYLTLVPNDIGIMMKLGIFCKEAGIREIAEDFFHRVIEKDPRNNAALALLAELDACHDGARNTLCK